MIDKDNLFISLLKYPRVVFDLDGTIYDFRDFERQAFSKVATMLREKSNLSLDKMEHLLWKMRELDRHNKELFNSVLNEYKLPCEWVSDCVDCWKNSSAEHLKQAPSLKPLLEDLLERGVSLSLVTNGYSAMQKRKVEALGLNSLFDFIIYCDSSLPKQLKPNNWGWSKLKRWRSGLATIYVGDEFSDEEFARSGHSDFIKFSFRNDIYEN